MNAWDRFWETFELEDIWLFFVGAILGAAVADDIPDWSAGTIIVPFFGCAVVWLGRGYRRRNAR